MNAISGLNAPRIAAAMVKLITMAENDWRNGMFNPSNGASMALMSALPSGREQDDERKFDRDVKRLLRVAPPAHRRAVTARAQNDDADVQREPSRVPSPAPGGDRFPIRRAAAWRFPPDAVLIFRIARASQFFGRPADFRFCRRSRQQSPANLHHRRGHHHQRDAKQRPVKFFRQHRADGIESAM